MAGQNGITPVRNVPSRYDAQVPRFLIGLLAIRAFAQTAAVGEFSHAADIGDPPLKGAAEFNADTKEYKITGTGADIWGQADQFHYVWREMSGNFAITATAKFLTGGNAHRKAVIMVRKTVDADSPFVHLAIHGDGLAAVQFRNAKADTTNTVDFPIEGPGIWRLKLQRRGSTITVWIGQEGAPLRELGHTMVPLSGAVLAGLGVSSHTKEGLTSVLFSGVTVEVLR